MDKYFSGKSKKMGIDTANYKVLIRIFKEEKRLEVWPKGKNSDTYVHYDSFDIYRF